MFWDEFGFSFQEQPATTWGHRGRRPILYQVNADRRAISTAVAFTLSGKIFKRHFEGSIHSSQIVDCLKHLQHHLRGKMILIWDRSRTHTGRLAQAYLAGHPEIYQEFLPPYAPELNAEEYCHGNVKQHLRNARPAHKEEIRSMLNRGFARLRRRPDLLLSFFHAAGLHVRQLRLT